MTPLPKRRHSSRRGGKRELATMKKTVKQANRCPKCKSLKMTHHACPKCGYYK